MTCFLSHSPQLQHALTESALTWLYNHDPPFFSFSQSRPVLLYIERIEDVVGMACGKRTIVIDIRRLLYLLPLGSLHMLYSTYFRSSYKLEPKQNILSQGRTIHMIGCSFLKPRYNILCLVKQDQFAEEKTEQNFFTSPAYV